MIIHMMTQQKSYLFNGGAFANTGVGSYTLTFADQSEAPHEDITVPIVLSADETKVQFAIQDNKLVKLIRMEMLLHMK